MSKEKGNKSSIDEKQEVPLEEEFKKKKTKFPILLFLFVLFIAVMVVIIIQTKAQYSMAFIPNGQIDSMLNETNKDRTVRLSVHSGEGENEERMAFLIDEKQREGEYEGNFYLELRNSKGEYEFQSQYYSDKTIDVLKSGFYKRYIKVDKSKEIITPEVEKSVVKYALLGDRENISTPNGIETTFKHELKGNELAQAVLLKEFSFEDTIYEKWYNEEDAVRMKIIPDSDPFPNFRGSVNEFLLLTNLDKATLYATFMDNELITWGIDFNFSYKENGQVLKEWKVYLDATYEKSDKEIKRDKLDIINSVEFGALTTDAYDFDENPYLNYENNQVNGESNKKEENDVGELDISIEELDHMLLNGSDRIKTNKE